MLSFSVRYIVPISINLHTTIYYMVGSGDEKQ